MDMSELLDPFERLLADVSTPAAIRAIEGGGDAGALWAAIAESGFLDVLVAEDAGGAGLSLAEISPLLIALGRHAVSVPVAETMVARALLAQAGIAAPDGAIILATAASGRAGPVPLARVASHVLVDVGDTLVLTALADVTVEPTGVYNDLSARLVWSGAPAGPSLAAPAHGLRAIAAVIRAAAIAGAADRLLDMTVAYANERVQFGKPIGKQQALQQNLAVMAEQAVSARLAAQAGCAGGFPPSLQAAAVAKQVASAVAAHIANTAHAVHGAIGISAEYDLQLFTRRLHEWRLADGAESWWAQALGALRLNAKATSADFVRG